MKNSFIKRVIKCACLITISTTACLFLATQEAHSQTTLAVGDIAFTGINCDGNDSFSFILLKDIADNTVIKFTDKGWTGTAFNTGEGEITYTNNTGATIVEKTQITIRGTGTGAAVLSGSATSAGSVSITSNLGPSLSGDQIFAYQGTTGSPTIIAAVHTNVEQSGYYTGSGLTLNTGTSNWDGSHNTSDETRLSGTGLTNGTNCVWLRNTAGNSSSNIWEIDNWRVKASALSGTVSQIRSACNDITNWDFDDANQFDPCAPVVASVVTTTTWNGTTWSNGNPSSTIEAVIASNTTPGAFTCEDLTINSGFDLTLANGVTATIHGDVTNSGNGTSGTGTLAFAGTAQALNGTAFTHAGVIEVNTGSTLTTNSKLTLSNGASLMHGTSTPNGGGTVSGTITFQKTIGSTTDGWRSFALPVDDLIENFETGLNTRCSNSSPSDRRNVYHWDGTDAGSNTATGWVEANNTTDDENKGYAIYLSNNSSGFFDFSSTVSISGTPNNGTKTFNLDYTYDPQSTKTLTSERGWNLIPNYFPSNLSIHNLINDADFDPTYKAVHVWDQGAGQMKAMNQSTLVNYNTSGGSIFSTLRQIPPFMSFWVKANTTSQSVQLKNSMRTGRSDSLPANTYFKHSHDVFRIEIKDQDKHQDQFSVAFIEGATDNFDNQYDIYKFKSFSEEVPTLYTKDNNGELISLAALPIRENYTVPVYLESEKDNQEYTVKALTEEYSNYYNVELVDNKTGTKTNLLEEDYTLNFDKNYTAARLTLNFTRKSATSVAEIYSQEKSYAYTNDNGINIVYQNNNTAAQADVEIYNTIGQLLFSQDNVTGGNGVSYMPTSTNTQVYIVRVISNGKANTIKVLH